MCRSCHACRRTAGGPCARARATGLADGPARLSLGFEQQKKKKLNKKEKIWNMKPRQHVPKLFFMPAGAWLEALARVHARPARLRALPGCLAAGSSECDFDAGLRRRRSASAAAVSAPSPRKARPQQGPAHWERAACRGMAGGSGGRRRKRRGAGWRHGRRRQRRQVRRACRGQRQPTRAAQAAKPWTWVCLRRRQCHCQILGGRQCWGLRAAIAVHKEHPR